MNEFQALLLEAKAMNITLARLSRLAGVPYMTLANVKNGKKSVMPITVTATVIRVRGAIEAEKKALSDFLKGKDNGTAQN